MSIFSIAVSGVGSVTEVHTAITGAAPTKDDLIDYSHMYHALSLRRENESRRRHK